MDEARHVIERLERIEALKQSDAAPREILGEIRSLLVEGERWLAAERAGTGQAEIERAEDALAHCCERLSRAGAGTGAGTGEVIAGIAVYHR